MESEKRQREGAQSGDEGGGDCHRSKCPRGLNPDITVVVGEGSSKESFECYSVVLRLASDVFDAMLATDMKERNSGEICLPDKDPGEWQMFYKFIDPASSAELNLENIDTMLPWFHEFRLHQWLDRCDDLMYSDIGQGPRWQEWLGLNVPELEVALDKIFLALQNAELYQLKKTEKMSFISLRHFIECPSKKLTEDIITRLKPFLYREKCAQYLWPALKIFLPEEMQDEDPKILLKNEIFATLLTSRVKMLEVEREADKKARASVESEHEDDIRQLCSELCDAMPNRKTAPMKVKLFVKRELERILRRRGMAL